MMWLQKIADRLPWRVITGGGDRPYLYKYLLWRSGEGRAHLHRFVRSDEDRELHNHPWSWGVSLILSGGYVEECAVRPTGAVSRRVFRPGMVNRIGAETYHRVELLSDECWTLFVTGKIVQSWGFWSPVTGEYTPWREFIARKGYRPYEGEYWREK